MHKYPEVFKKVKYSFIKHEITSTGFHRITLGSEDPSFILGDVLVYNSMQYSIVSIDKAVNKKLKTFVILAQEII